MAKRVVDLETDFLSGWFLNHLVDIHSILVVTNMTRIIKSAKALRKQLIKVSKNV